MAGAGSWGPQASSHPSLTPKSSGQDEGVLPTPPPTLGLSPKASPGPAPFLLPGEGGGAVRWGGWVRPGSRPIHRSRGGGVVSE